MTHMRAPAAISILLIVLLTLSGCGGKKPSPTPTPSTTPTTTTEPAPTTTTGLPLPTTTLPLPTTTTPPPTTTSPTPTTTNPPPPPSVTYAVEESRLKVTTAATNADWQRIAVKVKSQAGSATINLGNDTQPLQNEDASESGAANDVPSATYVRVATSADPMSAGDYMAFCAIGTALNVVITVRDVTSAVDVADFTFTNISPCPTLTFDEDEANDRLTVEGAGPDHDWNRVSIRLGASYLGAQRIYLGDPGSGSPPTALQNEPAVKDANDANEVTKQSNREVTGTYARVFIDQYLEFCASQATATSVPIEIVYTTDAGSQTIGTFTFTLEVAAC